MRIMAIDLGEARTGIALSDPLGLIATPYCVFSGYGRTRLKDAVLDIIAKENVGLIILGYPKRTDGKPGKMQEKVESFYTFLSKRTDVEIKLINEAFTTVIASQHLHDIDMNAKEQRSMIDAAAAAVLLQGYLDSSK